MKIKIISKKDYPEIKRLKDNFEVAKKADICIAIGGDGTFMRALKEDSIPVLPVRTGEPDSIGYHADVSLADIDYIVRALKHAEYKIETVANFLELDFKGKKRYAVNEVRINNIAEEVSFSLYDTLNGTRYKIYPYIVGGDGLLVTGMVGSTAYNRSAGGPIITTPGVLCVTLLNPDSPFGSPIVFDERSRIEVKIEKYRCTLRADSDQIAALSPKDSFTVRVSNRKIRLVKLDKKREMLGEKLERVFISKTRKV